ncbi:MAG: hypothetical protein WKG32_07825 [Gemmatimonadaceae bacterium]
MNESAAASLIGPPDSRDQVRQTIVRVIAWSVAATLGAAQAWVNRHYMNPDGVSYLDIGDAYARGDWAHAINTYFSPLYSWILGVVLRETRPAIAHEFTVVHIVNFAIYLGALACFDTFLGAFLRAYRTWTGRDGSAAVQNWVLRACGYSLFLWTSLEHVSLALVTPDMAVSAITYLAAALILRIRNGARGPGMFAALGALLGVGYLTKTAMFPLAFVFLTAALLAAGDLRAARWRIAAALVAFAITAGPFVAIVSRARHHFTFGDTARLNYAWYVNGVTTWVFWQGGPPGSGTPTHPPRIISKDPTVYEFRSEIPGTYPLWYDAPYWHDGIRTHFDPLRQVKRLISHVGLYVAVFTPILIALAAHWYAAGRGGVTRRSLAEVSIVALPAAAALVMYGLVYVETRFVGPSFVLLALAAIGAARFRTSGASAPAAGAAPLAIATVFLVGTAYAMMSAVPAAVRDLTGADPLRNDHALVAEALRSAGIRAGDDVAAMGPALVAYWARLTRTRIVAEMPTGGLAGFWAEDAAYRDRVLALLAGTGARVVVAPGVPAAVPAPGWTRVGSSGYAFHLLAPADGVR